MCAALHFFNMNDLSAPPSINGPSASVLEGSHITRCKYFNNTIANIVDTYVLAQNNENAEQDGVFNYASSLLSYGLFARCLHDASKEGDGEGCYYIGSFFYCIFVKHMPLSMHLRHLLF